MADTEESSSSPSSSKPMNGKPVVVRLKRKASQSRIDGLWLEITERPVKRPLLDFGKLSLSDSTGKDELKTKKIFVQHMETVSSSEAAVDILHSFVPESSDASGFRTKTENRRRTFKQDNQKRDQLLSRTMQKHEVLAKSARFEQIWKSRKEQKETVIDDSLREICHLYDVVRVEAEEEASMEAEEQMDTTLEDNTILCNYLPLIRELLPNAAAEIESDIQSYMSKQASTDGYVYDLYTVNDNPDATDVSDAYPLVQVDDEDFYDGQSHSENESDDSNAEDNPLNEYPDEETSEEDEVHSHSEVEEVESSVSGNQSEHLSEDVDALYEEFLDDDLGINVHYEDDNEDEEDDEEWRLGHL